MAARVIIWQSYNSIRCKLWHVTKCSSVWSVINGQLSNSNTDKLSAAQLPAANCLIPSSVISSQCDNVCECNAKFHIDSWLEHFPFAIRYLFLMNNILNMRCLPISLDLDNQLPNGPKLNQWFDCIPPNPFVLNTCNSIIEKKKNIKLIHNFS